MTQPEYGETYFGIPIDYVKRLEKMWHDYHAANPDADDNELAWLVQRRSVIHKGYTESEPDDKLMKAIRTMFPRLHATDLGRLHAQTEVSRVFAHLAWIFKQYENPDHLKATITLADRKRIATLLAELYRLAKYL
jgi:tRNA-dihydrouridine synthase